MRTRIKFHYFVYIYIEYITFKYVYNYSAIGTTTMFSIYLFFSFKEIKFNLVIKLRNRSSSNIYVDISQHIPLPIQIAMILCHFWNIRTCILSCRRVFVLVHTLKRTKVHVTRLALFCEAEINNKHKAHTHLIRIAQWIYGKK